MPPILSRLSVGVSVIGMPFGAGFFTSAIRYLQTRNAQAAKSHKKQRHKRII